MFQILCVIKNYLLSMRLSKLTCNNFRVCAGVKKKPNFITLVPWLLTRFIVTKSPLKF